MLSSINKLFRLSIAIGDRGAGRAPFIHLLWIHKQSNNLSLVFGVRDRLGRGVKPVMVSRASRTRVVAGHPARWQVARVFAVAAT
eukprot:scaffold77468_cov33-Tisochrysis_lutea.AAC.5